MTIFCYILIGLMGGIFGGLFGIGGGSIMVPVLVWGFGFSQHMAQGTTLFAFILPAFWLAAWTYYKAGHINIPVAVAMTVGIAVGGFLGARWAHVLPAPLLKKMFGVLIILLGMKLVLGK
ncbi:MAG: sulfite exporter TauE/SafE family protein [Elusimicrobia bacterium]|nr:sulfite exporter TauE/SafE family protein [Elusimicrobiota bacterium]